MNQTFMKEKKILPLVLSMALPMVVSMAVNSLYNIIDSYFIAKLSEDAMTALSLVFPAQTSSPLSPSALVSVSMLPLPFPRCKGTKDSRSRRKSGRIFQPHPRYSFNHFGASWHEELFVHVHKQCQCALSRFDVCQSGLFVCACRHRWYYL